MAKRPPRDDRQPDFFGTPGDGDADVDEAGDGGAGTPGQPNSTPGEAVPRRARNARPARGDDDAAAAGGVVTAADGSAPSRRSGRRRAGGPKTAPDAPAADAPAETGGAIRPECVGSDPVVPPPSLAELAAAAGRAELDELVASLPDDALGHVVLAGVRAMRRRLGTGAARRAGGKAAASPLERATQQLLAEIGGGEEM